MAKHRSKKKGGNAGKAGSQAKKAAKRRWEKRTDAIFLTAVGTVGFVVGHGVVTLQTPVLNHLAQIVDLMMTSGLLKHIAPHVGPSKETVWDVRREQVERRSTRSVDGEALRLRNLYGEAGAHKLANHGVAFKELAEAIEAAGPVIEDKWATFTPSQHLRILDLWQGRLDQFSGTAWKPLLAYLHELLSAEARSV